MSDHDPHSEASRCDCGVAVFADSFRDTLSLNEFRISGLCQACQDGVFIATTDEDGYLLYALRRGAVAACAVRGGIPEIAVLPFLFTAPHRLPVWEARYATYAAARTLPPIDASAELGPMAHLLRDHQVLLHLPASFDAPLFTKHFGQCELLVGLDASSLARVVSLCPALADAAHAPLAPAFVRRHGILASSLGHALVSHGLNARCANPGALRLCAWIGALLAPSPNGAPGFFPKVLSSCPDVLGRYPPWRMDAEPRPLWVSTRPRWQGYVT